MKPGQGNRITGHEFEAGQSAFARFRKEEPNADLAHYTILFVEDGDMIEVIFIPARDGSNTIGGATQFGREIHYLVAKGTHEIVKRTFAR